MQRLKVFELYSGIGGMHFALKGTEFPVHVIRAIDINPVANAVYKLNFPDTVLIEKNIQGLCEDHFNDLAIDMIMMSPPCQPFTRNGLRRDLDDHRNLSILHIIGLIPKLKTVKYILLENVLGFECSNVRDELIKSLVVSGFAYQEFLLTPEQFLIPNSRLRYYLLAKKAPLEFCFVSKGEIALELPPLTTSVSEKINLMNEKYKKLAKGGTSFPIELILDDVSGELLSENILCKYGTLLDIATSRSVKTCCFTKSYGRYIEGTGSVYSPVSPEYLGKIFAQLEKLEKGSDEYLNVIKSLKLRYFTPHEISRLMTFPELFKFPNKLSNRQKYRLLGNSINVHVVSVLTVILLS